MTRMTRAEVLRKCLILFDAQRRVYSRGNAGLEALPGAEESFQADAEICRVLREMLREMESGVPENLMKPASVTYKCRMTREEFEELEKRILQKRFEIPNGPMEKPEQYTLGDMLQGNPLVTKETIEAARTVDEARDKLIEKYAGQGLVVPNGPMEPDVPKVVELKEWQRVAAEKPPERLDFDEGDGE